MDYTNTGALKFEIAKAIADNGEIDLVVAWIHGTAPDAIDTIKRELANLQKGHPWTLVHIKGSSYDLSSILDTEHHPSDSFQEKFVQLGFVIEGSTSRWLTHQEISEGVIRAIQGDQRKTVVGTLEPWEKRP